MNTQDNNELSVETMALSDNPMVEETTIFPRNTST
jgi:hypothetical protein